MNPNQKFSEFVEGAVEKGLKSSDVINERGRIFREVITPALVKRGANDTDMVNARNRWHQQTDQLMQNYNFLPKDGKSMRSAEKNLRADRAVRESARTGSKLPLIKETLLSTGDTLANAFGQGANQMVQSGARFVNDVGENEQGTTSDRIANFAASNAKAFGKSASTQQQAIQAGEMGKTAQLGLGGVQSLPAMALPFGAAGLTAKGVGMAVGAGRAASAVGAGVGVAAGHTQNYGEVRKGSLENLKKDFPSWEKLQSNPVFEEKFNEKFNAGMSMDEARQQAYNETLDHLSENAADVYGTAMTALDVIAPDGALLGSGLLKHLPQSKLSKYLIGGTDPKLVQQQVNKVERVGLAKLTPDTSLAANKAALGMVARQGIQEGAQGAIGEYGAQAASADIGGTPVDFKKVGQSFVDEAIVGGIMGAGMQTASGVTPVGQAKAIADDIKTKTASVIQDEAAARQSLSQAIEFDNPKAIQEANADLDLVRQRAASLKADYENYGIEFPPVIESFINPSQQNAQNGAPSQSIIQNPSERAQQQAQNALNLEQQQQFEQVYGKSTPEPVINFDAISPFDSNNQNPVIDPNKLPDVQLDTPEKQSISGIVGKHLNQANQQTLDIESDLGVTDFGYTPSQPEPVIVDDPNLTTFDESIPSNAPAANIIDQSTQENGIINQAVPTHTMPADQQDQADGTTETTDNGLGFEQRFLDAHLNNPNAKTKIINDEIAKGRPRHEVLAEVSKIIGSIQQPKVEQATIDQQQEEAVAKPENINLRDSIKSLYAEAVAEGKQNNEEDANYLTDASSERFNSKVKENYADLYQKAEELAKTANIQHSGRRGRTNFYSLDFSGDTSYQSGDPYPKRPTKHEVLQQAIWHLSGKQESDLAPMPLKKQLIEQELDENGEQEKRYEGMDYGDIGRKSDGLPFANKGAAKNYQKKYSLENTHDVIQVGKGSKFVLRPKSDKPLTEQVADKGVYAPYNEIARQYGRSVTSGGVILTNKGKDSGVRIVEKNQRMRVESHDGKILFSAGNPKGLEVFFKDYWGDVKLEEGELNNSTPVIQTPTKSELKSEPKSIGKGDDAKNLIGHNQQGQSLYEDRQGKRSILNNGTLSSEKDGERLESFKTKEELTTKPAQKKTEPEKDQFANNTLFTSDAVAKARERLKKKLGQLNSGIDPEVLIDGMTIAGAYIESGVRKFGDFAKAMVGDFGDDIKPYLLSFWEGARNYPNLDTEGMTSVEDSKLEFDALNKTANLSENMKKVVGETIKKPKTSKTSKTSNDDYQLVQDWGVKFIDGWATNAEHQGKIYSDYGLKDGVKAAFLADAKKYLGAVQRQLEQKGYSLHLDKKGKPEKISVNESGTAGSGDVALYMTHIEDGINVYATVSESFLASRHPQRISIMFRATTDLNNKQASGFNRGTSSNQWAEASLNASELSESIDKIAKQTLRNSTPVEVNQNATEKPAETNNNQQSVVEESADERLTNDKTNTSGESTVRARGSDTQQPIARTNPRDVESEQSEDGTEIEKTSHPERSSLRGSGTDVASESRESQGRDERDGRKGTSGTRLSDAGRGSTTDRSNNLSSSSAVKVTAQDFHLENPLDIVGGTPVQRFDKNRQALELLDELESEGRQATAEEQKILAGYIGFGSFGQDLFQGTWEKPIYRDQKAWEERSKWLRERLGEQAWKSAQRSITNAHYTDPHTVTAMWDMLRRMGVDGGRILEPAMGTGNFFSMMPSDIKQRSQLTGIELDLTTGAIAKQLFPNSNIQIMGYQESKTPNDFYDVIVSNFPFENTPVADRKYNQLNPMLHDYFFLKAIDQVRSGGLVMSITSAGTMDKKGESIRRELAKSAELIAAIRLPSGAFKEYAGTDVVTDIIILRKRPEKLAIVPKDSGWIKLSEVKTPSGKPVLVNEYYANNPQNIIGTLDVGRGTTTFKEGMIVHRPDNMLERLKDAVQLVPEQALKPKTTVDHLSYFSNKTGERHGALSLVDGELMIAVGDQLVQANQHTKYQLKNSKETEKREQELKDIVSLRQLYTNLVDAERAGNDAETERKSLNTAYKKFSKSHGSLRDSFALTYLERINDPFFASIAALENDDGTPATILTKSTTRGKAKLQNPTISDAYIIARNQSISPSAELIAKISNKSVEEVRNELLKNGAVFETPNGDIAPTDLYLSGNVREKLREAQAAFDAGNTAMQKNIDALKEVLPPDVPYFNIETKMGAAWIPTEEYQRYIARMLNRDSIDGIEVQFKSGRWKVKLDKNLKYLTEAHSNFGSPHIGFDRLVQAAMSNQTLRLTSSDEKGNKYYDATKSEEANASLARIREEFGNWLWSDPERKIQMEREYNESMNAWATPKYDGSFMTMEGMALQLGNNAFNLRQHQLNAIWRAIANRRSMNAHEVGTGKTFTMGGIAIESRRYGIAKKPLILAHNANSASVAAEINMMYPNARVLYISELSPKVRALRLRQIANDDWDVVVMPHSMIDRLTLSEETLMSMAADDIAALEEEFYEAAKEDGINTDKVNLDDESTFKNIRSVTAKELAKARKTIIENIRKQAQLSSREDAVSFEELGVDMLLVDEVQEFKKPPIVTRMRMKGLNTQTSQRSIALQFLTRYVRRMNNGDNVHTFTGTYITNTITEIYHQMRYVMEEEMNKSNVADWDGWFGSFASEIQDVELTAAGEYEMVTRLAGFVNVPELRRMVGQFMDTVFAEDMPEMKPRRTKSGKVLTDSTLTESERVELLNGRTEGAVDRPYKKVINESAEMTEDQKKIFDHLQQLSREWRAAESKQRKEWMIQGNERSPIIVEGKANKASLDVRLNDESLAGMEGIAPDDPNSKASRVVKNVVEIYNSHPHANQVIFSDAGYNTSVSRSERGSDGERSKYTVKVFSTINDIVARLVQQGIPRNQIAVVTGSTSKEKRREIANAMNKSIIRVVIGSTDTLGVGVNMQRNLRAMHHLDAPYMPGDLEQRNGRGLRQANQWNTVLEYRYMTDRLDGRRWQILAVKQRFINAFMKANSTVRVIEGEAAADEQSDILESFSEAAGDPRVLQRVKLRKKLDSLQRKERLYTKGIADMQANIRSEQRYGDELTKEINKIKESKLLENLRDLLQGQQDNFTMEVDGKVYTNRKDAVDAMSAYIDANVRIGTEQHVFGKYAGHPMLIQWTNLAELPVTTIRAFGNDYDGTGIRGAEARMRNVPKNFNTKVAALKDVQDTILNLQNAVNQPFGQANDLLNVEKQLNDLELDLEINPVPPPAWLRQGAPIDSEVFYKGKSFVVQGHRYATDNYYVMVEDEKGITLLPYTEVTDQAGMQIYEQKEFIAPEVMTKPAKEGTETTQNSRKDSNATQTKGLSAKQLRSELVSRYGEQVISQLERNGVLEIVEKTPSHINESGIEGYYAQGKAVLIAENLTSSTVIPTFLHELGGHAGFQGMMKPKAYKNLMDSFNRMVSAGNPVAIEAKRRAEAETDAKAQQLEYLPYLLTVASKESLGTSSQKGAITRLIDRIKLAIKAFLVDRFNVKLNLSPEDMIALAERLIRKAVNNPPVKSSESQFSLNEQSHAPFQKAIDDVIEGRTSTRYVNMGKTPDVLKMLGLPDAKVFIHGDAIEKVMGEHLGLEQGKHSNLHNLTPETLRQLPKQLNDPVAVFKSAAQSTNPNGYLVLTELTEVDSTTGANKQVIAALTVRTKGNDIEVINIVSVYGRSKSQLQSSLNNDVLYWNKTKGQHFVTTNGLQLPQVLRDDADLSKANIKTNEDLVKYKNQPLFSRADTANPESLSKSKQKELLDMVGRSALGQMALLNAERAKTISKRTGSFFNTMLHKALQNAEFKNTFDLVQNKINHVTYASSASMDVAPDILTQLETLDDYKKEAKNVGQKIASTVTGGKVAKPQIELDLEKVGELLFTNTLSDDPKIHTILELRDLGFTDSQIELYRQARKAIETSLDEFAKTTVSNIFKHFGGSTEEILELTAKNLRHIDHILAIKSRINRIVAKEPDKAEAAATAEKHIDEVLEKLSKLKKEGYMPLMRFGKYYMRVIDPTSKEVAYRQHFESEAERNMFVRNFKVPEGYTIESSQTNELEHTMFQGVSPETLALFAKESGLPTDNMQEAFIKHAVRDNHALKRLLRRKGIQGFNEDTKRVIAAFVLSNSRYAANQLFNPAIDESIIEIKDPAYAEDAIRLRDYALDTKEELSGIKNFSFVWYMGFSFMFGLVNLSQPFLQTFPYLMQYSKDWSVTSKALVQAAKSWYGKDIPAKYRVNYERARKEGHLDPQNTWMLQGLERGKSGLGASSWQLISHAAGFFAQASETVNRRAALFASLDVAEQLGTEKLNKLGFKDAYDFAVRTIQETQGIYNKGNRPRVSRGNVGSLLMMYKQFMIAYVEQMVRMQRAGLFGGEDDEFKRKMAKLVGFGISRPLLIAFGVLWSFAGATGLPFVRDLLDVVETTGGMVGKPFNTEREIQIALHNSLGETLGESATTMLLDGFVNLNPVIDVKGRMGMGDLIPATAYFSPLTSEYQKSKELSSLGGAVGGLFQKLGDAMDFAKIGDYSQATMQLAPKAATSLGQGAIAATTGDYRNMQTGVKTNEASVLDGLVKALDAQPARIAKEGRIRGLEMRDKAAVQYNNKRAKEEYEEALGTGDVNEVNRVKQKIKDHNASNPRYPITLNLKTTETNFKKSNMSWQEKRKDVKGLAWMNSYNPYLDTAN